MDATLATAVFFSPYTEVTAEVTASLLTAPPVTDETADAAAEVTDFVLGTETPKSILDILLPNSIAWDPRESAVRFRGLSGIF